MAWTCARSRVPAPPRGRVLATALSASPWGALSSGPCLPDATTCSPDSGDRPSREGSAISIGEGRTMVIEPVCGKSVAEDQAAARATMRNFRQNPFWAFICNAIAVPVAALGYLNPILAAAVMALSSPSVIVNSALLKRQRVALA